MRIWGKMIKENKMIKDIVVENYEDDTRTHKIFEAIEKMCHEFDLSRPIWLDSTVSEFKRHSKCRFYPDNFIDSIEFDYLEVQVLEED